MGPKVEQKNVIFKPIPYRYRRRTYWQKRGPAHTNLLNRPSMVDLDSYNNAYMKINFRTNKMARMYIAGVILLNLPHAIFMST